MTTAIRNLVQTRSGLLDRRIFADKEIYQRELEQIFGRCWLFLGHDSLVSRPNDFFASRMGEDPVLLTRDAKGKLHAFLNMCRHRGNRVCRADMGNAPSFMCTYHGWTFATDGKLVGVPGYKEAYFEELDRSQWGLVETAQIDSYKGFVFATWDPQAPSLIDYMGDMAWYLDLMLDNRAGGTEMVIGVQKWIYNCNWKYPSDNNGGDGYHVPITHGSMRIVNAMRPGNLPVARSTAAGFGGGWTTHAGNGHGIVSFGAALNNPALPTSTEGLNPSSRYQVETQAERVRRLGEIAANVSRSPVFTMFPNFSNSSGVRIMHPDGPLATQQWSFVLYDKGMPQDVRDDKRREHTRTHGPSGGMEGDDMNNFMDCTLTALSPTGRKYMQNLQLGLGHETTHENYPGKGVTKGPTEQNQRAFYHRWAEIMDAPSWAQISIDPRTNTRK